MVMQFKNDNPKDAVRVLVRAFPKRASSGTSREDCYALSCEKLPVPEGGGNARARLYAATAMKVRWKRIVQDEVCLVAEQQKPEERKPS